MARQWKYKITEHHSHDYSLKSGKGYPQCKYCGRVNTKGMTINRSKKDGSNEADKSSAKGSQRDSKSKSSNSGSGTSGTSRESERILKSIEGLIQEVGINAEKPKGKATDQNPYEIPSGALPRSAKRSGNLERRLQKALVASKLNKETSKFGILTDFKFRKKVGQDYKKLQSITDEVLEQAGGQL